ncbi:MAG: NUDIX hydrolase N-terminal domain-containing protein [Prolixibacteraceae bacterium]|jgi:ADP-ribose pyrophosphatase YjhB (NUDIX family)|nr:NUDIX hydrolase N-terminal domain-containing protein [Prolixibacteraceae bacterium]
MGPFIFEKLKRIQALTETGLHYAENTFDRERYEEIQSVCLRIFEKLTDMPIKKIRPVIIDHNGYKTPKVDVRAVVFNEADEILMVREKADGCWSLPGGWADVGYTVRQVAEKECFEEAGIRVKAKRILAVLDKTAQKMPPQFEYVYKIFILCEKQGNTISTGSETDDAAWFAENNLPELSAPRNLELQIRMMFEYLRGERNEVYFD